MASIFLSHNSADKPFVRRLATALSKLGAKVWVDEAELKVGDSLLREIEKGIREMDYLGVVLSPAAVKSSWVERELEMAMNLEIAGKRVKVLPILHEDCDMPVFLMGKVYADCRGTRFDSGLRAIATRLLGEEPPTALPGMSKLQMDVLRIVCSKPDVNFTRPVLKRLLIERMGPVDEPALDLALGALTRGGYIEFEGNRYRMSNSVARSLRRIIW